MARSITRKQHERKKKTKKKKETNREKLQASIPGVKYTGSGKDPAIKELLKKLKKGGADSLDSSGMGTRWKV